MLDVNKLYGTGKSNPIQSIWPTMTPSYGQPQVAPSRTQFGQMTPQNPMYGGRTPNPYPMNDEYTRLFNMIHGGGQPRTDTAQNLWTQGGGPAQGNMAGGGYGQPQYSSGYTGAPTGIPPMTPPPMAGSPVSNVYGSQVNPYIPAPAPGYVPPYAQYGAGGGGTGYGSPLMPNPMIGYGAGYGINNPFIGGQAGQNPFIRYLMSLIQGRQV